MATYLPLGKTNSAKMHRTRTDEFILKYSPKLMFEKKTPSAGFETTGEMN